MSDPGQETTRNPDDWRKVRRFAVLDPSGETPGTVFPTVYVADELLVDPKSADGDAIGQLRALAGKAGWTIDENGTLEDPLPDDPTRETRPRSRGTSTSVRVRLGVAEGSEMVAGTPDAWDLLRQARSAGFGRPGHQPQPRAEHRLSRAQPVQGESVQGEPLQGESVQGERRDGRHRQLRRARVRRAAAGDLPRAGAGL